MRSVSGSIGCTGDASYESLVGFERFFAVGVFIISWFFPSPYGRFGSAKYGVSVGPRLGWFLMELPSTVSFLYFYLHGPRRAETVPLIFLAMWLIHYGNRGFFFPWSIRTAK